MLRGTTLSFHPGHEVYPTLTSSYSVEVDRAIKKYGKPNSVLSDYGSAFLCSRTYSWEKRLTEFEKHLSRNKVTFIRGGWTTQKAMTSWRSC